jgi:trk system potassium uptake protein TrkH
VLRGNFYSKLLFLIGVLLAAPLLVLPFYPEEAAYAPSFVSPALALMALSFIPFFSAGRAAPRVTEWQSPLQRGSLPVMFAWCVSILGGAMPFVLSGRLSFLNALFESVSGWTTTGLSVVNVAALPHILLFHRSFMQYCGGLGFIIIIAILIRGKEVMNLYNAEGHSDRIMPTLRRTTQTIFLIYNGFLITGTVLYAVFGMDFFSALCHTMSALSTAGFTTHPLSIDGYNSLPIEAVTIVLMLIGSMNFAILLMLVRGRFKKAFRVCEVKALLWLLIIFVPLTALSLIFQAGLSVGQGFHEALFGVVTVFSTTGYSTMYYAGWPQFAVGLLLILMIVGGGVGSTAGGIKLQRVYILVRVTRDNIHKRLTSTRRVTVPRYTRPQGDAPIDDALISDTFVFVAVYAVITLAGTLLLTLTADASVGDALFEFASALGTVGISNGITSPDASVGTRIVEMVGMLLGRLEIYIVFIGAYSGFSAMKARFSRRSP